MALSKVAGWPEQDSAVGFYRVLQPLRFLKREGLTQETRTVPFSGYGQAAYRRYSDRTFMEICSGADILHTTLLWRAADVIKVLNLRQHFGFRWVVDVDDNIFAASSDNPASDSAEDLRRYREACLRLADGVTVSVPYLKELYGAFNPNIYVLSNGLDFPLLAGHPSKARKRLRVGWRGAYGHRQDLELIRPAAEALRKEYDFDLVCFGYDPGFADEHVSWVPFFKEELRGKSRVEVPEYYRTAAGLGLDVALVPLIDSAYNRCKSNLNCLEWSALGVPVVFSPVENQKDCPGLPATSNFEWYGQMAALLDSPDLRRETASRQAEWARRFDMRDLVRPLAKWLDLLPRRTDIPPDLAPFVD